MTKPRLRLPMSVLRWVLVALYIAVIGGCLSLISEDGDMTGAAILLGVAVVGQLMLIFGAGTVQLCRPIHRRRLLIPVIAAATMGMILVSGLTIALLELFQLDDNGSNMIEIGAWSLVGISWMVWAMLLYNHAKQRERYNVLGRFTAYLLAGSLAELLVTVPSHIIVSRRPGCLVGLGTMLGITAGVYVMLFAFGPGIVWLFLRDRYNAEERPPICLQCHYDLRGTLAAGRASCPECGAVIEAH